MDEQEGLARRFEATRGRLQAVAYHMLGSPSEADDAVQEAWLRLSRADTSDVQNLDGWLTTVVARVCLDMLRSRTARREQPLDALEPLDAQPQPITSGASDDPEREALLADSVGAALLVVLDMLTPAERLAFVLHDVFDVPFEEIAPIVGRSPTAARQLASRARRRVQGQGPEAERDAEQAASIDQARQRAVVSAFLAASRQGDFDALLAVLDPAVVYRADQHLVATTGAASELHGAQAVARQFLGRAQAAQPALINGAVGATWVVRGQPRIAITFIISGGKVSAIEAVADPESLRQLTVEPLDVSGSPSPFGGGG